MASWAKLVDGLKTDSALENLSEEQIKAVIDILIMSIHADKKVTIMEEAELEHQLFELPWIKNKEEKLSTFVKESTEMILKIEKVEDLESIADRAAALLPETETREKVYRMASALIGTDVEIHPEEYEVLGIISRSFGI